MKVIKSKWRKFVYWLAFKTFKHDVMERTAQLVAGFQNGMSRLAKACEEMGRAFNESFSEAFEPKVKTIQANDVLRKNGIKIKENKKCQ